jgi:hypothetical protein
MSAVINHARLKELSKELRRPMHTLTVTRRDPFAAGMPERKVKAEWFAGVWRTMHMRIGAHIRRVHYRLISQPTPILMPSGAPFLNTEPCWEFLIDASLYARYLDLVPNFTVDRRNAPPTINMVEGCPGLITPRGGIQIETPTYAAPLLKLFKPQIAQRYVIEIWCEKSTINDILEPLGERFGVNIVTGIGELSQTRCVELVQRALESGRLVRILYISDFDPAGLGMPVSVARKIEFELHRRGLDLDIQLIPIALTYDQCVEFELPRTPIKVGETRAARFEERFGEGATELDALEALHEGELTRILEHEIMRYYDPTLERRSESVAAQVERDLARVSAPIRRRHAGDIRALVAEHKRLTALLKASERKTAPIMRRIERALRAAAPDLDDYAWPEPRQGNEHPDPLFDSTRDYIEQINRYKAHQGKPTERRQAARDT